MGSNDDLLASVVVFIRQTGAPVSDARKATARLATEYMDALRVGELVALRRCTRSFSVGLEREARVLREAANAADGLRGALGIGLDDHKERLSRLGGPDGAAGKTLLAYFSAELVNAAASDSFIGALSLWLGWRADMIAPTEEELWRNVEGRLAPFLSSLSALSLALTEMRSAMRLARKGAGPG